MTEVSPDIVMRFPLGAHLSAPIGSYVYPDRRTGLTVDLGAGVLGFVDGEHLPGEVRDWPAVREVVRFEVLRHDLYRDRAMCRVRLWPLDQRFRNARAVHWGFADDEWGGIRDRYQVGSTVAGTVSSVSPGNCWYTAHIADGVWGRGTWIDEPPIVGTTGRCLVAGMLDTTHRIILGRFTPTRRA